MNFQRQNFKNNAKGKNQEKDKKINLEEKKEQKDIMDYFIFGEDDEVNISVIQIYLNQKNQSQKTKMKIQIKLNTMYNLLLLQISDQIYILLWVL